MNAHRARWGVSPARCRKDSDAPQVREVGKAGPGAPVAVEATYGWYWAVDALQAAEFEVHLAHPSGLRALRKRKRVKNDRRDAYELANLLRLGSLPEAYIAPRQLRELRELVRERAKLVRHNTAVKASIRRCWPSTGFGWRSPIWTACSAGTCSTPCGCPARTRVGWRRSAG